MRIGIDVGGTFVDLVRVDDDGDLREYKVLATPTDLPGAIQAGLTAMAIDAGSDLRTFVSQIELIVHGTTITTNAVLTRSGSVAGLLTTEGLRDCLQMRKSKKEEPYNLRYEAPAPVIPRDMRQGVRERLDYRGEVVEPLDLASVRTAVETLKAGGVESVAVCFLHAYLNDTHERQALELVRSALPDVYAVGSADLWPQLGMYDRVSTTALSAYVGPKLDRYLAGLLERLAGMGFGGTLLIMKSNGGVMNATVARHQAVGTLMSGPAGGPRAALSYVASLGVDRCITMDMGGTSSDACLIRDGQPLVVPYGDIDRLRIAMPMVDIHSIGAGGGSIGWIDEAGLLRMGPASAGAKPGPACYGYGGTLPTCTDADLVLGYLNPDYFLGGRMPLYPALAREAIERHVAAPLGIDAVAAAAGMFEVINVNMAAGISEVSIAKGHDPREYALVVAGGAGPIHAALVAGELGIPLVVIPRASSAFCAVGMLYADLQHDYVRSFWRPGYVPGLETLRGLLTDIVAEATADLASDGVAADGVEWRHFLDVRYIGQFHEVTVPVALDELTPAAFAPVAERFHALHDQQFGYAVPSGKVEVINARVTAVGHTAKPRVRRLERAPADPEPARGGSRRAFDADARDFLFLPVYDGMSLAHGNVIPGPALIDQPATTVYIPGAYEVVCDAMGSYVMYLKDRRDQLRQQGVLP